jgi:Cys-tRNA(Pro)/Cys-tRNA(Cys) deacylase
MRLLAAAGVAYRTAEYEYDEKDLSGVHAARAIGMPAEQVFKTLVTRGDRSGLLVFCIPVAEELDLKKAAGAAGDKKLELVHVKEPEITATCAGAVPHRHEKKMPTFRMDRPSVRRDRRQAGCGPAADPFAGGAGRLRVALLRVVTA